MVYWLLPPTRGGGFHGWRSLRRLRGNSGDDGLIQRQGFHALLKKRFTILSPDANRIRHNGSDEAARRGLHEIGLAEREHLMAKFLFVYRGGCDTESKMTPEEQEQYMQKWGAWISEGMQMGWMLDPGDGLTPEGCVVNEKRVVTDGPFVESKEIVGGFSIVQADSLKAAAEYAKGCPGLLAGGKVEVRRLAEYTTQK